MNNNTAVINKFYSAFQQLDYTTMNSCYRNDIVFFDPVFGLLYGDQVLSMWEMLCTNARDFSLTYGNIVALDEAYTTCDWKATYTFSANGKTIVNKITANMLIADGQIIEHSDAFSMHQWSKQAFGLTGILFGWNALFQNKIKNKAKKKLLQFMQEKQNT